ncbi:MAG: alanine racemase [Tidjanibacter sp.]|nr:alanine racemase [Tidjanibacter sp.]
MNYSLKDIARIAGGTLVGADRCVGRVITDSRHSFATEQNPLFVAIGGVNHDGHNFIDDLYRRGLRAFMVERDLNFGAWPEAGFVVVERSLRALQKVAADYRAGFRGTVVAITGSTGKTTTKELIAEVAPKGVRLFRSPRSYNSQLGVALSLLMIEGDEDLAVIEAGISRPDEMAHLEAMIRPDVGIFTCLGPQHDENFIDRSHKASEKAVLFSRCGRVIYDSSNPYVAEALVAVREKIGATDIPSMVAALYESLGYDRKATEERLQDAKPITLKMSLGEGLGGSIILGDTHNSDTNSLAIALDELENVAAARRKVVILSDIPYSTLPEERLYSRVAELIDRAGVSKFIGVGEHLAAHKEYFEVESEFHTSVDELLATLSQDKIEGAAVLIKGHQMSGFDRLVHALSRQSHTTVLEVNLSTMVSNLNLYRRMLPEGTRLMAMVKASSYGHGGYEIATTLAHEGVDYLAVAFADEGVELRQKGITMPIVVLNADADSFLLMTTYRLEPEIYNLTSLHAFAEAVHRAGESDYPIHLKVDSGMHRLGFRMEDVEVLSEELERLKGLVTVRTIFSHLATADMPEEEAFVRSQQQTFEAVSGAIMRRLPYTPLRHLNNSAAIEHYPESHYDMCRLGIGLYGVGAKGAKPIARLTTRIVQVKTLTEGETVGYGRAGVIDHPTEVATIPIGYADGLDRRLGGGAWSVCIGGHRAPIVGRVCMDSCMIDVTGLGAKEGDEVVIFGGEGGSVEDMATLLSTIPYEVMTSISKRVKRIYIKE